MPFALATLLLAFAPPLRPTPPIHSLAHAARPALRTSHLVAVEMSPPPTFREWLKEWLPLGDVKAKATAFADKNFFLVGLVAAVGLAALIPGFGSAGGPLRPGLTVGWGATCGIFLLAGLGLPTSELAAAAVRVKEHSLIQGFSLGLIPLFTLGFVRVLAPLNAAVGSVLPGGVLDGLLALAALPTTVNMCVALTRSAGGSEALAIFNAVIGNLLGVFVTPALLLYLLGRESTIAFVAVFSKLCLKVLLPLCVGQLLRPVIGKATLAANKKKLGRTSECLLLLTVFSTFCDTFVRGFALPPAAFAALLAVVATWHVSLYAAAWFFGGLVMPTAADRVAYGFCSTHKSLALGLPLLRVVFSGDSRLALLITPLLVQHPFQLFFGSALVPRLTEIVAADKEKGA